MHSSRMHIIHCSDYWGSAQGVSAGGCLPRGCLSRGLSAWGCMPRGVSPGRYQTRVSRGGVCPMGGGGVCLPRGVSACTEADTTPCRQHDRQVLKHYLAATSLRTVNICIREIFQFFSSIKYQYCYEYATKRTRKLQTFLNQYFGTIIMSLLTTLVQC